MFLKVLTLKQSINKLLQSLSRNITKLKEMEDYTYDSL
jgi:hypothetical protein